MTAVGYSSYLFKPIITEWKHSLPQHYRAWSHKKKVAHCIVLHWASTCQKHRANPSQLMLKEHMAATTLFFLSISQCYTIAIDPTLASIELWFNGLTWLNGPKWTWKARLPQDHWASTFTVSHLGFEVQDPSVPNHYIRSPTHMCMHKHAHCLL